MLRSHCEDEVVTEDAFVATVLALSTECLGGIDGHLSDVSSDRESIDGDLESTATGAGVRADVPRHLGVRSVDRLLVLHYERGNA